MYKWEDANGVVTFKDTPPPASKKRGKVKVYSDSDFEAAPPKTPAAASRTERPGTAAASLPPSARKERFSGTVEMYVTDWCGYCKQAQSYMNSKGIRYVAYDIEKDRSAKQRHKDLGGRGVPLIIIGNNRMSGFSQETLEFYLNNP
jgi:glutaredoxin-like YruB-family protein